MMSLMIKVLKTTKINQYLKTNKALVKCKGFVCFIYEAVNKMQTYKPDSVLAITNNTLSFI